MVVDIDLIKDSKNEIVLELEDGTQIVIKGKDLRVNVFRKER